MSIGGVDIKHAGSTDLPYDMPWWYLQSQLRQILGFEHTEVRQVGEAVNGLRWVATFNGYADVLPALTFNSAGLQGGRTTPVVEQTLLQ